MGNLFLIQTFEQFKTMCLELGPTVFRESGPNWTSIESILDGSLVSEKGPHWADASNPNSQYLRGTYDFNKGVSVFYEKGF